MVDPEARPPTDLRFWSVTRRGLLFGGVGIAAAVATSCRSAPRAGSGPSTAPVVTQAPPSSPTRARPILSALHVHASFSEGPGSMEAQLAQAEALGYETVWWTEHDWRMASHEYLAQLPVDGPSTNSLTWRPGEGSIGEHHFVRDAPPQLGVQGATAVLLAASGSASRGEHRLVVESERHLYRTSLHGQTWSVPVHPERLDQGFLGLDLRTSWRPASGGRDEGFYWISYRFGTEGVEQVVEGRRTQVTIPTPLGVWSSLTLRPEDDFASAWPDLEGRDASCVEVSLVAEAPPGGSASGFFAAITIDRSAVSGDEPLTAHREIMGQYVEDYPSIQQLQGLELSLGNPHICWYGGAPRIPSFTDEPPTAMLDELQEGGGVASYAHPFGVGSQAADSRPQVSMAGPVLETLLTAGIEGCDAIEVGYRQRGGATLAVHESLWDALSRRGIFLTGLGVNDDHVGRDWAGLPNNFGSWLWAASTEEADLATALRSGHVYFGDPTLFSGQLDILPVTGGWMGTVVVGSGSRSEVRLLAQDLPAGSQLEVLRLEMTRDAAPVDSGSAVTATIPAADIVRGVVTTSIATAADCFVRTRVRNSSGEVIALSNPVWFVQDESVYPVPPHRQGEHS